MASSFGTIGLITTVNGGNSMKEKNFNQIPSDLSLENLVPEVSPI
jgi:hypothetical protein